MQAWAEDQGYPYELWTDSDKTLARYYDAMGVMGVVPSRVTMILDAEGELVLEYRDVDVSAHPADVLDDVKALFGG